MYYLAVSYIFRTGGFERINEDGGKDINSMHGKWIFIKEKEKKERAKYNCRIEYQKSRPVRRPKMKHEVPTPDAQNPTAILP